MAVVYRARDERLDRLVALKILTPWLAADEAFRQRFLGESRAAAAVDDPHIIPVFEAGEAGGVLFIAMRYVPGGDVRPCCDARARCTAARAAAIIAQVASALDAAHAAGPGAPGRQAGEHAGGTRPGRPDHVYLSDFGLSKAVAVGPADRGPGSSSARWTTWRPSRSRAGRWTGGPISTRWRARRSSCCRRAAVPPR